MAPTQRRLAHVGQSHFVQSALPLRAQPAEHVWHSRPSYPSAHCARRNDSWLRSSGSFSSAKAKVRFGVSPGVMLRTSCEGALSTLSVVPLLAAGAGVERRCRPPSQAFLESHWSIFKHASDVTLPVRRSFLQCHGTLAFATGRSVCRLACCLGTNSGLLADHGSRKLSPEPYPSSAPSFPSRLPLVGRFGEDLQRCACQCPGSGRTMLVPGQKPRPDGHGVHAFPPPSSA
jgi:hypothetical protein